MKSSAIYFDYNAATPLDASVRQAMEPFLTNIFANPSSIHVKGRQARAHLDEAHERMARLLQCKPSEIIFTSGGTEANNLAILGAVQTLIPRGRHVVTSAIEHHAVLECLRYLERIIGLRVTYIKADVNGGVSPDSVVKAVCDDTILVSIMAANNETGAVQPVAEIGSFCRQHGIVFHTDAVQWFGKRDISAGVSQFQADLVAGCAHKLHGPKGAGFLYIRSPFNPTPQMFGGPQENERRAGTENLAQIIGLVETMERFARKPVFDDPKISRHHDRLTKLLESLPGVNVIKPHGQLPNTVAFYAGTTDSLSLLASLDLEGICASAGAACASGAQQASHVLMGMGLGESAANSLVRLSLGRENTDDEVSHFCAVFPQILERLRTRK